MEPFSPAHRILLGHGHVLALAGTRDTAELSGPANIGQLSERYSTIENRHHLRRRIFIAADDLGHLEKRPIRLGRILQHFLRSEEHTSELQSR